MAFEEQITETIEAGAPSIKYEGDIQQQQQIAQQLWEQLPPEARAQFGSFEQFFSSGAWKKVLQALQQQMEQQVPQQGPQQMAQGPQQMAPQPQEGIGSMMPAQMARGGVPEEVTSLMEGIRTPRGEEVIDDTMTLASAPSLEDSRNEMALMLFGKPLHELTPDELEMMEEHNSNQMAYGGIAGADGRRQYGIGSWFQKKIMDPIKKNWKPAAAIGLGAMGLNKLGGGEWFGKGTGEGIFSNILKGGRNLVSNEITKGPETGQRQANWLGKTLMNPNFLIPAASLVSGAFAKQDDPGYTGQGTGLNLQDIAKLANITDEKQGAAVGLNFLPEASARKYSPEEMAATYAGSAQGGRIGAIEGGLLKKTIPRRQAIDIKNGDYDYGDDSLLSFPPTWIVPGMLSAIMGANYRSKKALKGDPKSPRGMRRTKKQEGGLMSLGGNEMDLRGGGFVPLGEQEKADDVPARLSKNEFVFTADAVRAAGGGNVDAGADKMYNTMKQLEGRVG